MPAIKQAAFSCNHPYIPPGGGQSFNLNLFANYGEFRADSFAETKLSSSYCCPTFHFTREHQSFPISMSIHGPGSPPPFRGHVAFLAPLGSPIDDEVPFVVAERRP